MSSQFEYHSKSLLSGAETSRTDSAVTSGQTEDVKPVVTTGQTIAADKTATTVNGNRLIAIRPKEPDQSKQVKGVAVKAFRCPVTDCPKIFVDSQQLNDHKKNEHNLRTKPPKVVVLPPNASLQLIGQTNAIGVGSVVTINGKTYRVATKVVNSSADSVPKTVTTPLVTTTAKVTNKRVERFKCGVAGCGMIYENLKELTKHFRETHTSPLVGSKPNKRPDKRVPQLKCLVFGCGRISFSAEELSNHIQQKHTSQPQIKPILIQTNPVANTAANTVVNPVTRPVVSQLVADERLAMYKCGVADCGLTYESAKELTQHHRQTHPRPRDNTIPIPTNPVATPLEENFIAEPKLNCRGRPLPVECKEMVINIKDYYERIHPDWEQWRIVEEMSKMTKIKEKAISRIIYEFRKHKKFKEPMKPKKREKKYNWNSEDRNTVEQVLNHWRYRYKTFSSSQIIRKVKNQNQLRGVKDVYHEMMSDKSWNISIRGCGQTSFRKAFQEMGFKITDTKIINTPPDVRKRELMAGIPPDKSKNQDFWRCDWPGCEKQCRTKEYLVIHQRTHTHFKPYECRYAHCDYRCCSASNFKIHLRVHNKNGSELPSKSDTESEEDMQ